MWLVEMIFKLNQSIWRVHAIQCQLSELMIERIKSLVAAECMRYNITTHSTGAAVACFLSCFIELQVVWIRAARLIRALDVPTIADSSHFFASLEVEL